VVQPQTQSETKTEAVPSTPSKAIVTKEVESLEGLPSEMIFKEGSFIYKEPNIRSQMVWLFPKNTQVSIVGREGDWVLVRDAQKRKGFVKRDVLVNKQ